MTLVTEKQCLSFRVTLWLLLIVEFLKKNSGVPYLFHHDYTNYMLHMNLAGLDKTILKFFVCKGAILIESHFE